MPEITIQQMRKEMSVEGLKVAEEHALLRANGFNECLVILI